MLTAPPTATEIAAAATAIERALRNADSPLPGHSVRRLAGLSRSRYTAGIELAIARGRAHRCSRWVDDPYGGRWALYYSAARGAR